MNLRSLIPIGRERSVARRGSVEPFGSLQREIERLFEDFARGWPSFGAGSSELTLPRPKRRSRSQQNCRVSRRRTCKSTSPTTS
jgi:hypothetical protein